MSDLVEQIANAVLYEGYILYPYRASSAKNRERFTFGRIEPQGSNLCESGGTHNGMQTECLVRRIGADASIGIRVRFLQVILREVGIASSQGFAAVPEIRVNGQRHQTWHEALEREVELVGISFNEATTRDIEFAFPATESIEPIEGSDHGTCAFFRRRSDSLRGRAAISVGGVDSEVARIRVEIFNETPISAEERNESDTVLLRTFASTHTILKAQGAEFLSATDPPETYAAVIKECRNVGTWPVLVGDETKNERDTMLSSPIILYDYPKIAPESAGDFCDGTEIDEMLTLRVLAMTDDEKREMRGVDDIARKILERTESLGNHERLDLHGTLRELRSVRDVDFFAKSNTSRDSICISGIFLKAGDRVRIRPRRSADAIDMMIAGKIGIIEAIEEDAENQIHLALVIEDDPGRDFGMMRQPGHRFFYSPEEIEPLLEDERCGS